MISITPSKLASIIGAAVISLLSACGGGDAGDSSNGFTANNTTNTKPQTSSADNVSTASSMKSNMSSVASSIESTLSSIESTFNSSIANQTSSAQSSAPSAITESSASTTTKSSSSARKVTVDITSPTIIPEITLAFTEYDLVVFSWIAATDNVGVTSYKIYRNQIQIDQIDSTDLTYADFNVAPNSSYTYGVSAGDAVGNWSPIKTILAKTQPQPIPPSSASSSSLSSRSSSSLSSSATSSTPISSSSLSSSATSSTPISSSSLSSSSAFSNSSTTSGDITAPSAPNSFYQTGGSSTQVDLGWTAATDNIGVTTYRIYRDDILLTTVSAATLEYSDKTATPSKTYTYGIEAGDAANNWSLARKTVSITTPASTNGDVTLYWAPPTQREDGSSITNAELGGFLIRYKSQTDTNYTYLDISDSSAKSRIITNLSGSYVFQIAVYDSNNLYSSFVSLSPH